jgi:hypothetical protein
MGRHRAGAPHQHVDPAEYDRQARVAAASLDAAESHWAIWYGVAARRFFAFAKWPTTSSLVLDAADPAELQILMRQAEQGRLAPLTRS